MPAKKGKVSFANTSPDIRLEAMPLEKVELLTVEAHPTIGRIERWRMSDGTVQRFECWRMSDGSVQSFEFRMGFVAK